MKYPVAALGFLFAALSSNANAWDGLVCNYSSQDISVKFDVHSASSFTLTVPKETNSSNRDVGGLCFTTISGWISNTSPHEAFQLDRFMVAAQACANVVVMVFDIPKENKIAGYSIRSTPGISPEQTCLQP